ncbi:glycoside hydrolase family 130 protein [Phycisphaerales bacterium AB-hyl4]|uniref:Glycoside hydrolase family 130 protein n=1 Tax=Natronomicrosphaera hydrolytica TaxID=3242702 RepID=A0ABV4U2A2_9BACT
MQTATKLKVSRLPEKFISDDRRVITRYFDVGGEKRVRAVIKRVLRLDEAEVESLLKRVLDHFNARHRKVEATFQQHFDVVRAHVPEPDSLSRTRKLLIGSYFTMEYSVESAALFNPSMVLHPDQSNLAPGECRLLMSLRATGEGHISSIVFRTGVIDDHSHINFNEPSRFAARLTVRQDRAYEKKLFRLKLIEMAAYNDTARQVLERLGDTFNYDQLDHAVDDVRQNHSNPSAFNETAENMLWLARSNYHLSVPEGTDPSEVVIFPSSDNESKGIEDVRLTRFVDDDGTVTYFGTYTAYNGFRILPQMLQTHDFQDIDIHTLNGQYVQNKGMALFPRKINGRYHMISRLDGENMFLMRSDNVYFWNEAEKLQTPRYPWEFVQIGNCGAPIETEAGWLMLTHGVGPMRQYCIGVSLLDLDDPAKVIGHLEDPLLVPDESERDGYVPNVVYSCGAVIHQDMLIIPYAMSDRATSFATVNVNELVQALLSNGKLEAEDKVNAKTKAKGKAKGPLLPQ